MRKILKVCGVLVLVVIAVAIMKPDEALNGNAKLYLDRVHQDKVSEAFLYHQAISAPAARSPVDVTLKSYAPTTVSNQSANENEQPEKLPLPSGDLFCNIRRDKECIETLFTHQQNVASIKLEHKELLSRYEQFLSFDEYSTLTEPNLDVEFPEYSYFFKAERVNVLEAIDYHNNGQSMRAADHLYDRIDKSRRMFGHQDSLIGKMVFLAILSDLVDIASIILHESGVTVDPIFLLTPQERDFSEVAAREFAYAYDAARTAVGGKNELDDRSWLVRELFGVALKTNMTVNVAIPIYVRMENLSTLSFLELSQEMSISPPPLETSVVWNPVGHVILSEFSASQFDEYVVRMFDFNAKLTLFNHRYHHQLDFKIASNPYFSNEYSEEYLNKVCFRSFTEEDSIRCLRTGVDSGEIAAAED